MKAPSEQDLARLAIYQALIKGLAYPSEEFMAQAWLAALAKVLKIVGLAAGELAAALQALNGDLQALQVEHTRLFINGVPHVLAPPYASVYKDGGQLMGQPAEHALRAYREAGLMVSATAHALPDHLAVELEFMVHLGRETLDADGLGDAAQLELMRQRSTRFLDECLLPWVALWRQRVEESARLAFYPALARIVEAWLKTDAQYLATMTQV